MFTFQSVSSKTIIRPPTDYVCPEVKCSEDCPRGYTHDIHGCNTCDCKHTAFQTEVGKCPKSSKSNIECPAKLSHSCDTDYDCSGGKKCCTFGCNRKCIYPKHGPLIYPPACGPGVCFISCPYGNIVDSRGCETCRCKPKPRPIPYPCPRIMCLTRHCYHGGGPLKDRHGCPTCGCSYVLNCHITLTSRLAACGIQTHVALLTAERVVFRLIED
ncbi:Hypothetical predicted protein [Mytilus galloprovincialis]|uniref:Antistasin-like domain-containing protein n=1 Tax=Mytilus galloprovincialis TaxID=29158 RepID=A0A8B6C320_MYTGA|nr:Hypothetical predicted protein [Mytilus galloprovincialis]